MTADQQPAGRRGWCASCGKGPKLLREDGMIPEHTISWPVSRVAVRSVGKGSGSTNCPGGGKPPKRGA